MLEIKEKKILFVEGITDQGFFEELLKHLGITYVQVIEINSKDKFKKKIPLILSQNKRKILRKIGLICDANGDKNGAFNMCKYILLNLKDKKLSSSISRKTTMSPNFYEGTPSLGIKIISKPSRNTGMLEDLLWKTVPKPQKDCIKQFLTCINRDRSFFRNYSKNKIYSYLAAQNEGLGSISVAAQKGLWNFQTESVFDDLKRWLEDLRD